MNLDTEHSKITKYAVSAGAVLAKLTVAAALVVLVHDFYGIDVRLSSSAPMVQVHLIVFENAPRISLHRLVNFAGSLFGQPRSSDQVCRENRSEKGRQVS